MKALRWYHVLVATLVLVSLLGLALEYRACEGRLVRGVFWWECVP